LIYREQIIEDGKMQKQQLAHAYGPPALQQGIAALQASGKSLW